ncbi:hypothetical protein JVT61DRAFT_7343 [Boletus reticuloceps]|uniref:Uncharacterized protein n=1 Tax=Boletus reticuloceps TaxID=495285 RepID=A0A8I2YJW3_9AGAM|nr:hypothetical protein JVT61DRAFT_7343 [Boletus reticuloceps]
MSLLENLRRAVWGNPAAFTVQTAAQDGQPVEYLDLGHHLAAVHVIFPGVHNKEILVLRGYQNAMHAFRHDMEIYAKGACISGQQRLGKSTFLAYVLIERLRERQPVAIQPPWSDEYILFTQNGTSIHNCRDQTLADHGSNLWALCDAKPNFQQPTLAFTRAMHKGVRIFLATTAANRTVQWAEGEGICGYFMDLWSIREIEDLGVVLKYDRDAINSMVSHASQYGPLPGLVTKVLANPGIVNQYHKQVERAINNAVSHPDKTISALFNMDNPPNTGPSRVFFIKPSREGDVVNHSSYDVVVPTRWLEDRLATALKRAQNAKKAEFMSMLTSLPQTCVGDQPVDSFLS